MGWYTKPAPLVLPKGHYWSQVRKNCLSLETDTETDSIIFYLLLLLQRLWFLIPWMEDDMPFLIPLWGWLLCWVSIGWVGTPQWFLVSGFKQHQMGRSPAIVEMAMSFWCKYIICIYTVYVCTLYIYIHYIIYTHVIIYIFIIYYHISLPFFYNAGSHFWNSSVDWFRAAVSSQQGWLDRCPPVSPLIISHDGSMVLVYILTLVGDKLMGSMEHHI